jgi:hypothetical protein
MPRTVNPPRSLARLRFLAVAGFFLLCVGCRSTHPFHEGILVSSHLPTHPSEALPLEFSAQYTLYSRPSLEEEGVEVLFRDLERADPLGFAATEGELFAVAGQERIPLPAGLYCWHIRPGSGPSPLAFKARSLTGFALTVWALSFISLASIIYI